MEQSLIEAEHERLNDLVDQWHEGDSQQSLSEFLGMSRDAYEYWLKDPMAYCKTRLLRAERRQRAAEQSLAVMARVIRNLSLCERVLSVLDIPLEEVQSIFDNEGVSTERLRA